ncbi:hypothetical protein OSB04_007902 [Centaurea solstitialis]|uniref:Uncharacterized protein n=1 Tax=Centaurea solstitialis TaxID=347529 RepID=A0AA38WJ00_9ASTR|nr:hypothetical protein OSB04_007902 [Centaurea solstitialis]
MRCYHLNFSAFAAAGTVPHVPCCFQTELFAFISKALEPSLASHSYPTMASASYIYIFALALLSITSNEMCYASRNLLQASPTQPQIPTMPTLPQPQMPTIPTLPQPQMPTMPTLPQPQMPTLPTLPQPQMPTIPTLPNMPKISLPPLPSMPTIPNLPTTLPKIPFFAPPPSKK